MGFNTSNQKFHTKVMQLCWINKLGIRSLILSMQYNRLFSFLTFRSKYHTAYLESYTRIFAVFSREQSCTKLKIPQKISRLIFQVEGYSSLWHDYVLSLAVHWLHWTLSPPFEISPASPHIEPKLDQGVTIRIPETLPQVQSPTHLSTHDNYEPPMDQLHVSESI